MRFIRDAGGCPQSGMIEALVGTAQTDQSGYPELARKCKRSLLSYCSKVPAHSLAF